MPSYSGVWNLVQQLQAVAAGNWPIAPLAGDIGLFGGGQSTGRQSSIEYVTIATTGNSANFGNLQSATDALAACSSSTRGLFGGGYISDYTNIISYVIIVKHINILI